MSDARPVSPRKVQQALGYLAGLHSDDPSRVREVSGQLQRWRNKSSEHERAWLEAEQRWQMIHRLTPQLRGSLAPEPVNLGRRRLLRQGAGLLAVVGCSAWLGWLWQRRPQFDQVLLTEHAAPARNVLLPDGSQMVLAAESNVQVKYSNGQREVMLAHGNVFFDVAHERLRSFLVSTRLGQVQVLGTAFSVSDRGGDIQVAVTRGHVKVRGLDGETRELLAGDRVRLGEPGVPGPVEHHPQAALNAEHWRQGWWSFTDAPLAEVIDEFNAYSNRQVRLGEGAAGLRLTGSFPSDRPDILLNALPRVLPLSLMQKGEYTWLQLR